MQLWDGLRVGNDVFIGPNVSFTNDGFPRSRQYQDQVLITILADFVSIGAGATILPGIQIGAGAVLTRSVSANVIVVGNPARIVGYVDAAALEESDTPLTGLQAESRVRAFDFVFSQTLSYGSKCA